jgi:hypothetical protein
MDTEEEETMRKQAYDVTVTARKGTKYKFYRDSYSDSCLLVAYDSDGGRREAELSNKLLLSLAQKTNAPRGEEAFTDDDLESMLAFEGHTHTVPVMADVAFALFCTDPRVKAIVARVSDGRNDCFEKAWENEVDIRMECIARAGEMWKI